MYLDKEMEFSYQQAVTVSAASEAQLKLGSKTWAGNSVGAQEPIPLIATIDETFDTAGEAGTLTIGVRSSASADMSNPTVHAATAAIPEAALVAGADLSAYLGSLQVPWQAGEYLDAYFTVGGGPFTAGKITLRGATGRQTNR